MLKHLQLIQGRNASKQIPFLREVYVNGDGVGRRFMSHPSVTKLNNIESSKAMMS